MATAAAAAAARADNHDPARSLYAALGVCETATEHEIKHAFFRAIRRCQPRERPDLFETLNTAASTLTDPRRRAAYDQTRLLGRQAGALTAQAGAYLDKDVEKAVALLQNAVALAPNLSEGRVLLAVALARAGDAAGAETHLRWLIEDAPRDETLRLQLAQALWRQKRFADAERELRAALVINARYHDALLLLARVGEATGRSALAADALEQAIGADGVEDNADLDTLVLLLALHVRENNAQQAERTAGRIEAVLSPPGDTPRRRTAAACLLDRAHEAYAGAQNELAEQLLRLAARRADESDGSAFGAAAAQLKKRLALAKEARTLCGDGLVAEPLRAYVRAAYLDRSPGERRQATTLLQRARLGDAVARRSLIEYLGREYPLLAADLSVLLTPDGETLTLPTGPAAPSGGHAAPARKGIIGWLRGNSTNGER